MDFGKLDENSSRNKGGTGLGLSICKQIIEQMGGSISILSKQGEGTQFVVNVNCKSKINKASLNHDWIDQKAVKNPQKKNLGVNS